jgi:hypothetical protein
MMHMCGTLHVCAYASCLHLSMDLGLHVLSKWACNVYIYVHNSYVNTP